MLALEEGEEKGVSCRVVKFIVCHIIISPPCLASLVVCRPVVGCMPVIPKPNPRPSSSLSRAVSSGSSASKTSTSLSDTAGRMEGKSRCVPTPTRSSSLPGLPSPALLSVFAPLTGPCCSDSLLPAAGPEEANTPMLGVKGVKGVSVGV